MGFLTGDATKGELQGELLVLTAPVLNYCRPILETFLVRIERRSEMIR